MTNLAIDFSWQQHAECRGLSVDLFYVGARGSISQEVKDACDRCPVREECLNHALHHEAHGYWAGTSGKQRIQIRASRGIVMKKPEASYWEENKVTSPEKTKKKEPAVCGTFGAYQRHIRRKETVDPDCRKAQQEYRKIYKEKYEKKK